MPSFTIAWRSLWRAPAFTIAAVLTLAIGAGATTAVFTVLHSIIWKPLPYKNPERLAGVWISLPKMGFGLAPQSQSSYFTYRKLARSIDGIAIIGRSSVNLSDPRSDAPPERMRASLITASTIPLLGVPLERGRNFTDAEDAPGGSPVVIISDGLWRRRYGADDKVIGTRIQLDGLDREIIGVASPGFHFPDAQTQLWLPSALDPNALFGGAFGYQGFVRLRSGQTLDAAQREFTTLLARIPELYPNIAPGMATKTFLASANATAVVHPLQDDFVGGFGNVGEIAGAACLLLFLIAVANVASLLIARSEDRQRELAVRVALGASPFRVLTQFLAESLILAGVGGALGLLLAIGGVRAFVRFGPAGIPRLADVAIDQWVILFSVGVVAVMALVCSLVPALRSDTNRLSEKLRDGARGGTSGRNRQRARRTLVVAQVAFATVLVAGVCVLVQSFERLRQVRPGFDTNNALTFWISFPRATYRTDGDVVQATSRLLDGLSTLPGVRASGASSKIPLLGIGAAYTPIWSDAIKSDVTTLPASEQLITATGSYFSAMGVPVIAGRTFEAPDRQNSTEVIIDRSLSAQYFNDSTGLQALGHRVRFTQDAWYTIVGVVGAVHDTSLAAPANGLVYFPDVVSPDTNRSFVARTVAITVRTTGDPQATMPAIRRVLSDVDHAIPAFGIAPMTDVVGQSTARLSFVMVLLAVTAVVALVLATIGLYGVLSYMVTLRQREIGVRLALGALPGAVSRLIARQGMTLAVLGVVAGGGLFVGASRVVASLIPGVGNADPVTILVVPTFLMIVALGASWIPAGRAARVDPARTLGAE